MSFKNSLLFVLIFFSAQILVAQTNFKFDSLKNVLQKSDDTAKARIYNELAWAYRNSEPQKTSDFGKLAVNYAKKYENYKELATAYGYLGVAYRNFGNFRQAMEYYDLGLKICEENNLVSLKGYAYINIGNIYLYKEDYDKAFENLNKALELSKALNDKEMEAYCCLNIGRANLLNHEIDVALVFLNKALQIRLESKNLSGASVCYNYIGDAYLEKNEVDKALEIFFTAQKNVDSKFDKDIVSDILSKTATIYISKNQYETAETYAKQALEISLETHNPARIRKAYETLTDLNRKNGNLKDAVKYQDFVKLYNDSVYKKELSEKISNLQFGLDQDKKDVLIKNLNEKKELQAKSLRQQNRLIVMLFVILGLVAVIIVVIIRQNRHRQRANFLLSKQHSEILEKNQELHSQNEEITAQRDEISKQKEILSAHRDELELKNDEIIKQAQKITDSIIYAQRIQNALLPPENLLKTLLPEYFILFKPRDIVSGDFYWVKQNEENLIVVLADCTGHGIPGAFVSMLGMSILNEVVENTTIRTAAEILESMRTHIKLSLRQSKELESQDDGIDMALCIFSKKTLEMQFAGANNGIYLIRDNQIHVYSATLNPVGIYFREIPFKNNIIQLQSGDSIYLYSDGFIDQFGGEDGRRFMSQNFKTMILENSAQPMSIQKTIFEKVLQNWQGNGRQIDDISLMGIRF